MHQIAPECTIFTNRIAHLNTRRAQYSPDTLLQKATVCYNSAALAPSLLSLRVLRASAVNLPATTAGAKRTLRLSRIRLPRYNNPRPQDVMYTTAGTSSVPLTMPSPTNPVAEGDTTPDAFLVDRLRKGEAAAGEALVKKYYQPLVRYLQRLVGNEQLAEEMHQQTWLSVLEHLDRFDARHVTGGFKAWLFRIATNKANDFWRSSGRERAAKDGLRRVTDEQLPPADFRLEGTEQEQKLKRAIDQLPDAQKQVLMLRYYSNLKFVEIAEMLGCPLNTALGRMHKAMLKLKDLMAD
jgi:RNA polymerase sigma-70 factor, ECF subfamily